MALRDLIPWRKHDKETGEAARPLASLRHEMDRLFDDFFHGFDREPFGEFGLPGRAFTPKVNVSEDDAQVKVTAELPGVTEKEIEVTLAQNTLTLKGEKKEEHEEKDEDKSYHRVERRYGSFVRTVPLPTEIDEGKVDATFKDGVLTVTLPKTEAAQQQRKKVAVKAG